MSNKKISELEVATAPTSSDIIPLVSGGENKTLVIDKLPTMNRLDRYHCNELNEINYRLDHIVCDNNGNMLKQPADIVLGLGYTLLCALFDVLGEPIPEEYVYAAAIESASVNALIKDLDSTLNGAPVRCCFLYNISAPISAGYTTDGEDGLKSFSFSFYNEIQIVFRPGSFSKLTIPDDFDFSSL